MSRNSAIATFTILVCAPLGALGASPTCARAQVEWSARFSYERQVIRSEEPQWSDWERVEGETRADLGRVNAGLRAFRSHRFGLADEGVAGDLYVDLTDRAYAYLSAGFAPEARVTATQDHAAALFFSIPGGWEASVGYRYLRPAEQVVQAVHASVVRYLPGWYLRLRADFTPSLDENASFFSGNARRYIPALDGYVEAGAGAGREVVEVSEGPVVDLRTSRFAGVRAEVFPTHSVGLTAGLAYHYLRDLPERWAPSAGVVVRW